MSLCLLKWQVSTKRYCKCDRYIVKNKLILVTLMTGNPVTTERMHWTNIEGNDGGVSQRNGTNFAIHSHEYVKHWKYYIFRATPNCFEAALVARLSLGYSVDAATRALYRVKYSTDLRREPRLGTPGVGVHHGAAAAHCGQVIIICTLSHVTGLQLVGWVLPSPACPCVCRIATCSALKNEVHVWKPDTMRMHILLHKSAYQLGGARPQTCSTHLQGAKARDFGLFFSFINPPRVELSVLNFLAN